VNITVHICNEDDLIALSLSCVYGNTKIMEEGCPWWARVPLTEEVEAVLGVDAIGLGKGRVTRLVGTDDGHVGACLTR